MLTLPSSDYDVVGSIVAYKTDPREIDLAVRQFLAVPLRTHLFIIDNSPAPLPLTAYDAERVTYHFAGGNLGYGRAHNLAIRAAQGKSAYSLIMNTDIEYAPHVVTRLRDLLEARPTAALVCPKVLYRDGSLQHVCRLLPTPANMFLRRFLPNAAITKQADSRYELRWWKHDKIAALPYFQGSFMMMRTAVCNGIGGFDERFFLYGEDIDLSRRLYSIAETLYVPDVSIVHDYRRYSNSSLRGTWYGIQNNCRYFNKWGWFFDAERSAINRRVVAELTHPSSRI